MTSKIVVFGSTGQLARALRSECDLKNRPAVFFDRITCDFSQPNNIIEKFLESMLTPAAIIIAAAYTAVDQAESDAETAHQVNAETPSIIAKYCVQQNIPLVHISTDYVFDGSATVPYTTNHPPNPQSIYGASKLAGEKLIMSTGARAAILRTSWVFDGTGKNFLTTMLRLAETRNELSIVADQFGRPTFASHLAQAVLEVTDSLIKGTESAQGLFHVTGSGAPVNWADFAAAIFDEANYPNIKINKITTNEYPTAATRPAYSVLDLKLYDAVFKAALPDWRKGLTEALVEWKTSIQSE